MMDMWYKNYYGNLFAKYDELAEQLALSYDLGDLDGDGVVSLADAMKTLKGYTMIASGSGSYLDNRQLKCADVDLDQQITLSDAQLILMYYTRNALSHQGATWEELRSLSQQPD